MSTPARRRRARLKKAGATPPRWKKRLLDLAILGTTAAVCVFIFSMSSRLGYSRADDHQPPIIIRAQVLNACGRAKLAARTSEHLSTLHAGRMRFDVIDIGNFNRTDVRRSFIINHGVSDRQAKAIADALNIGPVDIVESQTGLGELGIDVTLVLGSVTTEPWLDASPSPGDTLPKED
ncbi:MAG: hypothetical protein GF341_13390 [candidate division Zixibacteria bacterium]|nr:hypothetical protein [candidate division Zixibacteria bacterium]